MSKGWKIEDFFATCETCKGTGEFQNAVNPVGSGAVGITSTTYSGQCQECKGDGGALTDDGKVLQRMFQIFNKQR